MPTLPPIDMDGQTLGRYEIVDRLGAGGMGTVYRARDPDLDRFVAIKVLAPALESDPTCVERFKREARSIAALRHPNLMHVYEVGSHKHLHYFVMEYIDGSPLSRHLKEKGALGVSESLRVAGQVLSALDKVHAAGIVHRDLKPANIMIDADGRAVVLDFGLSKDTTAMNLTGDGTIMGTPDYMAPEQIEGEDVGPATDTYALGVMLYEMLAGKLPFHRKSAVLTMRAHCEESPPPLAELKPDLPAELIRIVERAISRRVPSRYQSAMELAKDLASVHPTAELRALASAAGGITSAQTVLAGQAGTAGKPKPRPRGQPQGQHRGPGHAAETSGSRPVTRRELYVAIVAAFVLLLFAALILRRRPNRGEGQGGRPRLPGALPPRRSGTALSETDPLPRRVYEPEGQEGPVEGVALAEVRVLLEDGTFITGSLLSAEKGSLRVRRKADGKTVAVKMSEVRIMSAPREIPATSIREARDRLLKDGRFRDRLGGDRLRGPGMGDGRRGTR